MGVVKCQLLWLWLCDMCFCVFFLPNLQVSSQKMQSVEIWHILKHNNIVQKFTSGILHFTSIIHVLLQWHGHVILVVTWKLNLTSKMTWENCIRKWVMTMPIKVDWIHKLYTTTDKAQKYYHTNRALACTPINTPQTQGLNSQGWMSPFHATWNKYTHVLHNLHMIANLSLLSLGFHNSVTLRDTHRQVVGRHPLYKY